MSIDDQDVTGTGRARGPMLLALASAEDARADARVAAAAAQMGHDEQWRIGDRARVELTNIVTGMIASIEGDIRAFAARALAQRGMTALSDAIGAPDPESVGSIMMGGGLLHQPELVRELIGRVQQDMMADALPGRAPMVLDEPSLIVRLATGPDGIISAMTNALMVAESRRRAPAEQGQPSRTDLPAELHHRLVWWVAAAIAIDAGALPGAEAAALDRALADAVLRSLAAHDEGDRLEAAAMQLATAINASPEELPGLLADALEDRRLPLFIALAAQALGLDYDVFRDMVVDPGSVRLWVSLRALDLPRETVARIGLALSEADPRRDVDAFADQLDDIMAIPADDARHSLTSLRRHPEFRAAARAMARGRVA